MASEVANMNGNYTQAQSQGYDQSYNSHSNSQTNGDLNNNASSTTAQTNGNSGNSPEIPKDEVGWYFVEQYYTTLSRSPEKLYLFYNKRSQFVSGTEAEKVAVSVGQKSINERIKELDFQDCKVRVTNVDSQGSGSNIVIQVIGEISTKSLPQKKFTQTFVLAEQQNGYFVLNDIFRYLLEEDEEVAGTVEDVQQPTIESGSQESKQTATETVPQTQANGQDSTTQDNLVGQVDQALEQAIEEEPALAADVSEDAPAAAPESAEATKPDETMPDAAPETTTEPAAEATPTLEQVPSQIEAEKPKDPEPTPIASPPKPAAAKPVPATPVAPPKPAAPKTWASMLAANAAAKKPAVPALPAQTPAPAAVTPKAASAAPTPAPQAATPTPSTTTQAPPTEAPEPSSTPVSTGSEWQTAGADNNKKARTQQAAPQPEEGSRGYIKNVTENIDGNALRAVLSSAAKVKYLDISKVKNCAFVDYESAADYQAAVAANPYEIDGLRLVIEERKFRPGGNPGFTPRGPNFNRGGRGGGGPSNGQPGRGGMQRDGGRGGGFPRGGGQGQGARGGVGARGGRGGAPAAA